MIRSNSVLPGFVAIGFKYREIQECHTVVFFIISDECNGWVMVLNFGTQDILIPFDHPLKLVSSVNDMGEFIGAFASHEHLLFVCLID